MPNRTAHILFLAVFAAVLFSVNIWGYDLWPADEPRYAEAAREMLLLDNWLVPHVNGEPYYEKPPLLFWSIAAGAAPFGEVTETAARLPSVIAGIFTVLLTYLLARRLFGPHTALWAGIILITTQRVWWQARTAQIDMLLTACLMLSIYALWRWEEERNPKWLWPLYGGVALGMLAKGPPALVFPFLLIIFFYWKNKHARTQVHWVIGFIAAIAVTAAWYFPARMATADTAVAAVETGIGENLFRNIIGRIALGVSKAQPPWYYLETIPLDLLPWTLFLPWTLWWIWRNRREGKAMRFLLAWTMPALIFFSISVGKRAIYILPLFPAFAIFIAASLRELMAANRPVWRRRTAYIWALVLLVISALPVAVWISDYTHLLTPGLWAFGAAAIGFAVFNFIRAVTGDVDTLDRQIAGQTAVLFVLTALFIFPIVNVFKSASPFCKPLRTLNQADIQYDLYSVGFSREEYIFYAEHFHTPVLTGLVGRDKIPRERLREVALMQRRARELIEDAVEEVPLRDITDPTAAELRKLRDAITGAIAASDETTRSELEPFEKALRETVDAFATDFADTKPAFLFVRDEDWRWLLPMHSKLPEYQMIRHEHVGSREVLLLANTAGYEALEASQEVSGANDQG